MKNTTRSTASMTGIEKNLTARVIAGLRAGGAREQAEASALAQKQRLEQDRLWDQLLQLLATQYDIPAEAITREAAVSRYLTSGFYEGPVTLCGVRLNVVAQFLSGEQAKGLTYLETIRPRFTRRGRSEYLTAEEIASLVERGDK